jgi:hypothetical protein
MFNSKSFALKAILPVAGVALAAGVIGTAAPAKAMTIVFDDYTNPATAATNGTGTNSVGPTVISSNPQLGSVSRTITLATTQLGTNSRPNSITVGGSQASLDLGTQHSGSALFAYNFNAFNFASTPEIKFDYDFDAATVAAPVTFQFTLGARTLQQVFTNGASSGTQVFDFRPYLAEITNVQSASLRIIGGSGRDVLVSNQLAATVPVPPAILATGVGALIGGLKAARKRKQQAVMA